MWSADLKKRRHKRCMYGHCCNIRIVVYVLIRTAVYKVYVTPLLLSFVLFVNKVLTLFTCNNGFEKGTGANENQHTCEYVIWFKIKIFWHPAITDSRHYGYQIAVPRVSTITGVDYNWHFNFQLRD